MTSYVLYLIIHLLLCTVYCLCIQRPTFYAYNRKVSERTVTGSDLWHNTVVGFKSDIAGAAYLTALPLLTLWVCSYCPGCNATVPLMIVQGFVALLMALVTIGDTVLYGHWRFRIDVSVLAYLRSLKGAVASVTIGYLIVALVLTLMLACAIFAAFCGAAAITGTYARVTGHITAPGALGTTGVFLAAAVVVFACIRGIKHRPNSPYQLYYSTNMFMNHTAINPIFNIAYSASVKKKESDQFKVFDPDECTTVIKAMLPTEGITRQRLLRVQKPNILIIIWESLSAYFVEPLGGKTDVTPNLNRLCREGILFDRVDAGSWRTDPAMVCILSGYPAQPTTSIMRDTHKLPSLPSLPRSLKANGYTTSIVHGGPLSYMHMIDYYMALGHDRIIGIDDIAADAPKCAWGVHDGYMFDWLYEDIAKRDPADGPWCTTMLTLSSHQPYKVPYKRLDDEIENSYAYTDEALGRMIGRLKQTSVWDDILIIILGDHGINISFLPMPRHMQTHIPLLMTGGAIAAPRRIDTLMSQTDLAATLLGQLGIKHDDFAFSRDVLADTYTRPFAINIFNNGFLYRDPTGYTEYDNTAKRAVDSPDVDRERLGRMFMQYMMDDLNKK